MRHSAVNSPNHADAKGAAPYTIEPKTGGDTGRKSTWTVNAKKVGAAFSGT